MVLDDAAAPWRASSPRATSSSPSQTRLVLVDHNEITQAVSGAEEVQITEIIDHHRLGP